MKNDLKCYRVLYDVPLYNWKRLCVTQFDSRVFEPAKTIKRLTKEKQMMNTSLVITKKYPDFDGRIITNEAVIYGGNIRNINVQWDCGSTCSSISRELIAELGLQPVSRCETTTSIGTQTVDVYTVELVLNNDLIVPVKADGAHNIHTTGIDMLIGMDVISLGDFAISTYKGETCFSHGCLLGN